MSKREGFPPGRRVRKRPDYLEIQGKGRRFVTPHFLVFVLRRRAPGTGDGPLVSRARFGITVSRKVGSAVTRNRIKRWVRECCRREASVGFGWDVVVVAKPQAAQATLTIARAELASVWSRLPSTPTRAPSGRAQE